MKVSEVEKRGREGKRRKAGRSSLVVLTRVCPWIILYIHGLPRETKGGRRAMSTLLYMLRELLTPIQR